MSLGEYLSAKEISNLLEVSVRAIQLRAKKEMWNEEVLIRKRSGRGGGLEYHFSILPKDIQRVYSSELKHRKMLEETKVSLPSIKDIQFSKPASSKKAIANIKQPKKDLLKPNNILDDTNHNARQRKVMSARMFLLDEFELFLLNRPKTTQKDCVSMFIKCANSEFKNYDRDPTYPMALEPKEALRIDLCNNLLLANDRNGSKCRLSVSTFIRWRYLWINEGDYALIPKISRKKEPIPEWFYSFLKFYSLPAKPTMAGALEKMEKTLGSDAFIPSYKQVRVAMSKVGNVAKHHGRESAQALLARKAYVMRDTSDLMPTSVYTGDGKTFDAEVAHPKHGGAFKPEITSILDVYTRKLVGWSVGLAENSTGVIDALRVASVDHGIAAVFYSDNGAGFKNKQLEDDLTGILGRLGTTEYHSIALRSQSRGLIEKFNANLDKVAKRFVTYIGKDMDKMAAQKVHKITRNELKKFKTSRTLPSWDEFMATIHEFAEDYNNKPHSSLPKIRDDETFRLRHMSPNEMWQRAVDEEGFEPISITRMESDDLFRPYEVRTAQRCMVSLYGNSYFAIELEEFNGDKVSVGYDIHDPSQVWIREIVNTRDGKEQGALICVAKFEGNKERYIPVSMERRANEVRAKGRKKRIETKLDAVEQELNPNIYLEASDEKPMKTIVTTMPVEGDAVEVAKAPVIIEHAPEKVMEVKPKVRMNKNGFPIFSHFTDKMNFFMEHPEKLTDHYYKLIKKDLSSPTKRDIMDARDIDIDLIREILNSYAATMEKKVA